MSFIHRAAIAASFALIPCFAFAHATLEQREAKAGSSYRGVLRVPHGCEGKATNTVRLRVPEGVYSAKPMPKPGWTVSTVRGAYAKSYDDHGRAVTEGVKEIVWSGGALPDDQYDEFVFIGSIAPDLADGAALYFPAVQECGEARQAWVDVPAAGQSAKMPAPMVRVAANAMAQSPKVYTLGAIRVKTPWTRATPKGAPVGGGYLQVTNTGATPDRLVGGTFPIAGKVEVHEMSMDGGMMRMKQLPDGIEIAPGASVELKPGGYHMMFLQLKEPIVEGQPIKGTLVFEKAGALEIEWAVSPIGAPAAPAVGGEHSGHQH